MIMRHQLWPANSSQDFWIIQGWVHSFINGEPLIVQVMPEKAFEKEKEASPAPSVNHQWWSSLAGLKPFYLPAPHYVYHGDGGRDYPTIFAMEMLPERKARFWIEGQEVVAFQLGSIAEQCAVPADTLEAAVKSQKVEDRPEEIERSKKHEAERIKKMLEQAKSSGMFLDSELEQRLQEQANGGMGNDG